MLNDLVNSKLKVLQDEIMEILEKWHYDDIDAFLNDARDGTIEDAEDDAVCLRNLFDKREWLFQQRNQWNQALTSSFEKLELAKDLLLRDLKEVIVSLDLNEDADRIKLQLSDGTKLSVQYIGSFTHT